jgi:hypothetical protein
MREVFSRKVALIAALGVLAAAIAVAVATAGGSGRGASTRGRAAHARLRAELREGKSLAQIAKQMGKSEAGLLGALEAAQATGVDAAGKRLDRRVLRETRTPGVIVRRAGLRGLRAAAVSYLGLTGAQIATDQDGGKTLAQIAQSTAGKSESGLIQAILGARRRQLAEAVKAGTLSASVEAKRLAKLEQRITAFVQRAPGLARRRHSARSRSPAS